MRECITTPKYSVAINGGLASYLSGAKGLRQGDPLSPYLLVLAMEFLTQMLKKRILGHKNFEFHPRYENMQLIILCFADD